MTASRKLRPVVTLDPATVSASWPDALAATFRAAEIAYFAALARTVPPLGNGRANVSALARAAGTERATLRKMFRRNPAVKRAILAVYAAQIAEVREP